MDIICGWICYTKKEPWLGALFQRKCLQCKIYTEYCLVCETILIISIYLCLSYSYKLNLQFFLYIFFFYYCYLNSNLGIDLKCKMNSQNSTETLLSQLGDALFKTVIIKAIRKALYITQFEPKHEKKKKSPCVASVVPIFEHTALLWTINDLCLCHGI